MIGFRVLRLTERVMNVIFFFSQISQREINVRSPDVISVLSLCVVSWGLLRNSLNNFNFKDARFKSHSFFFRDYKVVHFLMKVAQESCKLLATVLNRVGKIFHEISDIY